MVKNSPIPRGRMQKQAHQAVPGVGSPSDWFGVPTCAFDTS